MIKVFDNIDITNRNSFHVVQRAARLIEVENLADLRTAFADFVGKNGWLVVGGGNNILFTSDIDRTIIVHTDNHITIVKEDTEKVIVSVGAGVEWDNFVEWAVEHNLWGVENLSLIPGKVGAAPVQNIGAYGAEAKDSITNVTMFCPSTNNCATLAASHCDFGYRESVFKHTLKGKVIITEVEFCLHKNPAPRLGYGDVEAEVSRLGGVTLQNIRTAICNIRRSKLPDPAITGNAGSFFKNPIVTEDVAKGLLEQYPTMPHYIVNGGIKLASGWLIDQCGLKGYKGEKVGVHPRQALVLINLGGASGGDVIDFAHFIQGKVAEKFGIDIEMEVNII